jgi:hypothetical protein
MVNTFINCSSLRTLRTWRLNHLQHTRTVNEADHSQSYMSAPNVFCRRNGGGMSACGRNRVPVNHRLLDANICTMSPARPMAAIPDGITPTGHILCAAEGQHKECPSRVGTVAQPLCVQFKSPWELCQQGGKNVATWCHQDAFNAPTVCQDGGANVPSSEQLLPVPFQVMPVLITQPTQ